LADFSRALVTRLIGERHVDLYRISFALMATTAANAVLGLLFWVAAARLYPPETVGAGAGGISALQLVSVIGWVGLQFTIMRYAPIAGKRRLRLILAIYGIGVGSALLVAATFLLFLAGPLKVGFLASSPVSSAAFLVGVAFWVVFSLQDAVLVGIRRPVIVLVENAIFGALKLGLLIALAAASQPWTLLGVWIAAAAVMVLIVNSVLLRLVRDPSPSRLPSRQTLVRFSTGHTGVALATWIPDFLVPLMVLAMLGEVPAAHYYAAWTVAFAARLLVTNMASALTVEAAYGTDSFGRLARSSMRLAIWVLTPTVTVLVLGAALVLRVFGPGYGEAALLLRLFAVSIVPSAIVAYAVAADRNNHRFGTALVITASGSAVALALDLVLIPLAGLTGAGIGWLVGQTLAALIALATMRPLSATRRRSARFGGGRTEDVGRCDTQAEQPETDEPPARRP
jgi:O-antigen/teichoic acid export membrane protein